MHPETRVGDHETKAKRMLRELAEQRPGMRREIEAILSSMDGDWPEIYESREVLGDPLFRPYATCVTFMTTCAGQMLKNSYSFSDHDAEYESRMRAACLNQIDVKAREMRGEK